MSDLFNNAVASIRMGVEDYTNKDGNRALSAVRNFYSGVLLLAKEVLVRTTPEATMQDVLAAKYKPVPDGKGGIEYVPENQQTLDFSTLGKRFKDFGLPLDQKALEELNRVRNDIEHRYTTQTDDAVREAIARAFPVTADLFRQLGENPSEILGEAWQLMLDTRHLYEREVQQCRSSRAAIQWYSRTIQGSELQCTRCSSNLVEQIDSSNSIQSRSELHCRACGTRLETEEVIIAVLADEAESIRLLPRSYACINNWDLVDTSAPDIVGEHLVSRSRRVLYRLAESGELWQRRIAMVATLAFIQKGDLKDTFGIAERLLADEHDLIHKAIGWMLREAGDNSRADMIAFLERHYSQIPRTALRYAIEHLPQGRRKRVLRGLFA
jgi:3-methyladenine DNA glycosylase AlkD